jgi:hypothetical protein
LLKVTNHNINPVLVTTISALLIIVAQWIPYFIFILPAAILLVIDTNEKTEFKNILKKSVLIFLALAIGFTSISLINNTNIIGGLASSLTGTLAVITYLLFNKYNNNKLGQITFLIIWLGFQYLLIKTAAEINPLFLADSFASTFGWTKYTGYLGIEVWIFWIGLNLYTAFFRTDRIVYLSVIFALVIFLAGIFLTFNGDEQGILKDHMLTLYIDGSATPEYLRQAEWMARTAAWVSVLLIVLTFVSFKTRKLK